MSQREDEKEITIRRNQDISEIAKISKMHVPGQGTPNMSFEDESEQEEEEEKEPPQIGPVDIEIQIEEKDDNQIKQTQLPIKVEEVQVFDQPRISKEEKMLKIKNEQSFKGTRILLFFI